MGFLAVLVSAVITVVAVARRGERSVLLLLVCFLLTLFVLTFLVGELFEGSG